MGFEAFWIPGLNSDFDPDRALAIGYRWLDEARYGGRPVITLNAASMLGNRPALARAASRYEVISPRTRNQPRGTGNAILAVWPDRKTLDLAETMAHEGGLCVIPNSLDDVSLWISRTGARNLADPDGARAAPMSLNAEVRRVLDSLLSFDGHNGFYGAGGKERAVRDLREMVNEGYRPEPREVEEYAVASRETDHDGAVRLREIYEGVLAGRRFRDSSGRVIR